MDHLSSKQFVVINVKKLHDDMLFQFKINFWDDLFLLNVRAKKNYKKKFLDEENFNSRMYPLLAAVARERAQFFTL